MVRVNLVQCAMHSLILVPTNETPPLFLTKNGVGCFFSYLCAMPHPDPFPNPAGQFKPLLDIS